MVVMKHNKLGAEMVVFTTAQYMALPINGAFSPDQTPEASMRSNIARLPQTSPTEMICALVDMGSTWQHMGKHLTLRSVKLLRDADLKRLSANLP